MAGLIGIAPTARLFGADEPALSPELRAFSEVAFVPSGYKRTSLMAQAGAFRPAASTPWPASGRMAHRFVDDYYDRIHLTPRALALGNVVSQVVREIAVWNAWRTQPAIVTALVLDGDTGMTLAPDVVPVAFAPLQERTWTLTVATEGPPLIDARLAFVFASDEMWSLRITGQRLQAWTLPPNWTEPVAETLAWLTDVQTTLAGAVVRTPLRDAPRRSWEFSVFADRAERRAMENLLYDWSARTWALPVFVDTTWLRTPVPAGATSIALDTTGLDFVVGGLAMLWRSERAFELVEISTLSAAGIGIRAPTQAAWPVGTRLMPCRTARLTTAPELRRHTDRLVDTRLQFEATEPCDWLPIAPTARYRGVPVLEDRPDWSDPPTATFARRATVLDGDVGRTAVDDVSGLVWTTQSHAWRLFGRAERAAHRSLLYWLQGRAEALWLPTWTDDVEIIKTIGETALLLVVAWAGIARSLHMQAGRRHLRIELYDGTIFYRAIEAVDELERPTDETHEGVRLERVRMDVALGRVVAPERVRLVSWMALVTLAGDTVELQHHADSEGLLDCNVAFASIGEEEP